MKKLQKLIQSEDGRLFCSNFVQVKNERRIGKMQTLVVKNPCVDISNILDEFAQRDSGFIPKEANSYVASDFNGDTQHIRKDDLEKKEKVYSVYSIQFYNISEF